MDSDQVQTPMTQTRPSTAGLIELHVYLVPEDVWNPKLNKVTIDVIWRFISLGFIRVTPDMKLRTLRDSLAEFLGEEAVTDKFVFLKCVGSSLAVICPKPLLHPEQRKPLYLRGLFIITSFIQKEVKAKQEHELKLKAFAPPYAREPELYLLPGGGNEDSTYGSGVTPDQQRYRTEYSGSDLSDTRVIEPLWDKSRNSPINENKPVTSQPHQQEHGGRSYIWNRKRQEIVPISKQYHVQTETDLLLPLTSGEISDAHKASEDSEDTKKLTGRNPTGDSGIADSLLGAQTETSHRKRQEKPLGTNLANSQPRNQQHQMGGTTYRHVTEPAHYQPPPSPPLLPDFPTIQSPKPQTTTRNETIPDQLKWVKEERIQLERSREEMIKRIKSLLEQYRLRRHQARDSWKKKYFETKKVTSALEETLNKLKNDQDIYYQKLLTHLAARDTRQRTKNPTLAASSKNSLIMKITSKQQELDQLKRKVENARTKLLIEMKMRKQASADLHVLKAELAHKKATLVLASPPLYAT